MLFKLKKILFLATYNLTLLTILMIGIQNSSSKMKVNLIIQETVNLPVSFIMGISFISGSILGGFLKFDLGKRNI